MRKYNFNDIKKELETRKLDNEKRQLIYKQVLKCINENTITRIDKRVLDLFKNYFTDTDFKLYYHNENETWKQEKYIRIYYNNNYTDYEDITLFYVSKISNSVEKTINDLQATCISVIEHTKEREKILDTDLTDLETKVNEFNNLMVQVDNLLNKYKDTELHYILQVKEY